jgi:hypothetical protein
MSSFIASTVTSQKDTEGKKTNEKNTGETEVHVNLESNEIDELEIKLQFAPEKGNVLFACSLDSWAFSLREFSEIIAKRLGVNPKVRSHSWNENSKIFSWSYLVETYEIPVGRILLEAKD